MPFPKTEGAAGSLGALAVPAGVFCWVRVLRVPGNRLMLELQLAAGMANTAPTAIAPCVLRKAKG